MTDEAKKPARRMYATPEGADLCYREPEETGFHCAHLTGRSTTDGMAREGVFEAKCCHCGARADVPWEREMVAPPGHGPHAVEPMRRLTLPEYWLAWDEDGNALKQLVL